VEFLRIGKGRNPPLRNVELCRLPLLSIISHTARLPSCRSLQSTTHRGTKSPPITARHRLSFNLHLHETNTIELISIPLQIAACTCHAGALIPPSYSFGEDRSHDMTRGELCACEAVKLVRNVEGECDSPARSQSFGAMGRKSCHSRLDDLS